MELEIDPPWRLWAEELIKHCILAPPHSPRPPESFSGILRREQCRV
jgi:hypothetical protein